MKRTTEEKGEKIQAVQANGEEFLEMLRKTAGKGVCGRKEVCNESLVRPEHETLPAKGERRGGQ